MKNITLNIFILLALLVSCSKHEMQEIIPGETTITEAIDILGEPMEVKTSSFNARDEMFHFEQGVLQVEKKQVKVIFRNPIEEEEKNLQYWREQHKESSSTWNALRAPSGLGQFELKYPSEGVAVIFDSNIDKVIRIIKYEPKQ
jgi:hypothetical protein